MALYAVYENIPGHGWRQSDEVEAKSGAAAIRKSRAEDRRRGNEAPSGTKYKAKRVGSNPARKRRWDWGYYRSSQRQRVGGRTPAQIRATKKLVAMNKKRSRGNPRKRKNSAGPKKTLRRLLKSARQLTRGHKATAKWVRSGMPAQRNKAKRCNPPKARRIKVPKGWIQAKFVRVVRKGGKRIVEVKR